jgi:hypothetical protein
MKDKKIVLNKNSKAQVNFYSWVKEILETARVYAHRVVNAAMVERYWHIGKEIVEQEQQGADRAEYGIKVVTNLSKRLSKYFGRGFDPSSFWNVRKFYLVFPIPHAVRGELSWTY